MSLIPTSASVADAPEKSRPLLDMVNAQLGVPPSMFRLISTRFAASKGHLGMSGALAKGRLVA